MFIDAFQLSLLIKLVLATMVGAIIGLERTFVGKAAGFRTFALISLGSCLFTILSIYGFSGTIDTARVASNIVVGIGFLGAGLIIFHESKIKGLTTAAGLWTTAALGMAIGIGFYKLVIFAAILVFITLNVLAKFETKIINLEQKRNQDKNN